MKNSLLTHIRNVLLIGSAAGVFLAILAPLGSHNFTTIYRFVFWIVLCVTGGTAVVLSESILERLFSGYQNLNRWVQTLIQSLFAALAVYLVLVIGVEQSGVYSHVTTFAYTWVISIAICTFGTLLRSHEALSASDNSEPALLKRLSAPFNDAQIYALSAEDHYVKVHTSEGHTMLLMRFRDAVEEIKPLPGLVTHRSWWVSESGVKSLRKKGRSAELMLRNDVQALVSRSGFKLIREAGWLK